MQQITVLLLVLAVLGAISPPKAQTALHLHSTLYQRLGVAVVEILQPVLKTGLVAALVEAAPKTVVLAVLLQVVKEILVAPLQGRAPMVLLVEAALARWVALALRKKGEVMVE